MDYHWTVGFLLTYCYPLQHRLIVALLLQVFLAIGMKLKYSLPQLLTLNNRTIPTCTAVVKKRGLLWRPRYIHRSSRHKFVYHQHDCSASEIPSIWTTVAHLPCHQNSVALDVSNTGSLHSRQDRKCGVNSSILRPLQRFITLLTFKI